MVSKSGQFTVYDNPNFSYPFVPLSKMKFIDNLFLCTKKNAFLKVL